jgi:hypothetical protein
VGGCGDINRSLAQSREAGTVSDAKNYSILVVMHFVMPMKKLDLAKLQAAYDGK